ncbi:MAG: amidohydrolase family protein [Planctomycetota bacterium]
MHSSPRCVAGTGTAPTGAAVLASALLALILAALPAVAQPTSRSPLAPPPNGMARAEPGLHAITGATAHLRPGIVIENATVLIRDGVIESVTSGGAAPGGYRVHDARGHHVYAAFIESYAPVDAPRPDGGAPGEHWNPRVMPHRHALDGPGMSDDTRETMRSLGFAATAIAPKGGVFRGMAAVASTASVTGGDGAVPPSVYRRDAYHSLAFEHGGWSDRTYPGSHMGAVALVRQVLFDADRRAHLLGSHPEHADEASSLDALIGTDARVLPAFVEVTGSEIKAIHAIETANETDRTLVLVGDGREYRRLSEIAGSGVPLVMPVDWPRTPKLETAGQIDATSLTDLMHWEQAPTQPRRFVEAHGSADRLMLTTFGLKKPKDFLARVRDAIHAGLDERDALAMVTTSPAKALGVADRLGSIEQGKIANLLICDGPVFAEGTHRLTLFIDGRPHALATPSNDDLVGTWNAVIGDGFVTLGLAVERTDGNNKCAVTVTDQSESGEHIASKAAHASVTGDTLSFSFDHTPFGEPAGLFTMTATLRDTPAGARLVGTGVASDGAPFGFTATRTEADPATGNRPDAQQDTETPERFTQIPDLPGYPFGPYAYESVPEAPEHVVIRNATIWTAGPRGILENATMHVEDGLIRSVGADEDFGDIPQGAVVIDARGHHVTPGIIDAHSHTGTYPAGFSANEGTQAVTSEVRISDSIDPGHINFYRQLAGGVTAVNTLHGSANPIGGQNYVTKLRWGSNRLRDIEISQAPAGIKFALGENVKQSNWGDSATTRYPQTRMGVETLIRDRFVAAQRYASQWDRYLDANPEAPTLGMTERTLRSLRRVAGRSPSPAPNAPPRRDLELEAIAEILGGSRLVHCHSYRQDEILMLCRIAGEFGFTIGTFQHVLEGYKVAEAIREHALGASAFSDWWAFKFEVVDAIPYAGPIMWEAGVNVSYNSDDDSLARRLNLEAAKAIRYAQPGISLGPNEALKFVTLNPAIQLGIDHLVGSLELGKHADFVIWSGEPLSTESKPLSTWIDGAEHWSVERDEALRERVRTERHRLLQKALAAKGVKSSNGDGDDTGDNEDEMVDGPQLGGRGLIALMRYRVAEDALFEQVARGVEPSLARCEHCACLADMLPH